MKSPTLKLNHPSKSQITSSFMYWIHHDLNEAQGSQRSCKILGRPQRGILGRNVGHPPEQKCFQYHIWEHLYQPRQNCLTREQGANKQAFFWPNLIGSQDRQIGCNRIDKWLFCSAPWLGLLLYYWGPMTMGISLLGVGKCYREKCEKDPQLPSSNGPWDPIQKLWLP